MKKLFYSLLLSTLVLFVGCSEPYDDTKIKDEIDDINSRLDKIEDNSISSVEKQVSTINNSILLLTTVDSELRGYISALEKEVDDLQSSIGASNATDNTIRDLIEDLKAADRDLSDRIDALIAYVNSEIGKAESWCSATFATLEQYESVCNDIAIINALIAENKDKASKDLENAISDVKTSLKDWVNEQLDGYYTIAEINAKISTLENKIASGDTALQSQVDELKEELADMKTEITTSYQEAITKAINDNNGYIVEEIYNSYIAPIETYILSFEEEVRTKLSELEAQVNQNTAQIQTLIEVLVGRIQSISYIPRYSDGRATMFFSEGVSRVELDFEVSPKSCVSELVSYWETILSLRATYTTTRAVHFVDLPIVAFTANPDNGTFTIKASGENLSEDFFEGEVGVNVSLAVNVGENFISVSSEYIPLVAVEGSVDISVSVDYALYIPDASLKAYLLNNYDINNDGALTIHEVEDIKSIVCPNADVESAKGIEHFTNLTTLDLSGNNLSEIDLSKNNALTDVWLKNNPNLTQITIWDACTTRNDYLHFDMGGVAVYDAAGNSYGYPYEVGQYIPWSNGGVVFTTTNKGTNGKMISVEKTNTTWGLKDKKTNATDGYDGRVNVQAVKEQGYFEYLPAFVWCEEYGKDAWYLPAKNELLSVYAVKSTLNETLKKYGFVTFSTSSSNPDCHWSSTDSQKYYSNSTNSNYSYYHAWYVYMNGGNTDYCGKYNGNYVRAVSAF